MVKRYQIWPVDVQTAADVFEVSDGEMAVTEIVFMPAGYSWKQWCEWGLELEV